MVLRKGRVVHKFHSFLDGTAILSITRPMKILSKVSDRSLQSIQGTIKELETWLPTLERVWLTWQVRAMELPTRHPASSPLASAEIWSNPVSSEDPGDQPAKQPHQLHCTGGATDSSSL